MKTVREILRHKGEEVWSVGPDATVLDVLRLMAEKEIGAVLVLQDERAIGIVSERDYARKVVLMGRSSSDTPVREIMTPDPVTVPRSHTAEQCMALMTERRIRHLPVVEADRLLGLVSIGDVVKAVISDRDYAIRRLEDYITGG